jgi:uncharacterized protein YcfL
MKKSFLKLSLLVFVLFFCYSCQSSTTNTDNAVVTDSIAIIPTEITETSATTDQTETTEETQSQEFAPIYTESIRSTTAQTTKGSQTKVYRSDDHGPSGVTEWIGVISVPNDKKILEIWYWNANGEQSRQFDLISQNVSNDKTLEYKGKLNASYKENINFSMTEDSFMFDLGGDEQEFTHDPNFK